MWHMHLLYNKHDLVYPTSVRLYKHYSLTLSEPHRTEYIYLSLLFIELIILDFSNVHCLLYQIVILLMQRVIIFLFSVYFLIVDKLFLHCRRKLIVFIFFSSLVLLPVFVWLCVNLFIIAVCVLYQ